jgi:hypothetical protein
MGGNRHGSSASNRNSGRVRSICTVKKGGDCPSDPEDNLDNLEPIGWKPDNAAIYNREFRLDPEIRDQKKSGLIYFDVTDCSRFCRSGLASGAIIASESTV